MQIAEFVLCRLTIRACRFGTESTRIVPVAQPVKSPRPPPRWVKDWPKSTTARFADGTWILDIDVMQALYVEGCGTQGMARFTPQPWACVRSPPDLPGVQEVRGGPRMRDPAVADPPRSAHCHKGG